MATLTQDILPYRLKRKEWEGVQKYAFITSQDKRIGNNESSLQCRIPLTLVMTQCYGESAVYRLKMSRPSFNGSRDYDKLQWVFSKLMSVSREVHIRTRRAGSVWEILNKNQIRSRWTHAKKQITEMYEDPLVDDIMARYEQNMTHHFESIYKRAPMLQLLFNDLYRDYTEGQPVETEKILTRHLRDIPFAITERKQLMRLDKRNQEAVINLEGIPDMARIDQEAVSRYLGQVVGNNVAQPYEFTYKGQYRMDTVRGIIREAELQVEGMLGEAYSKKTNYHVTCTDDA